jgi:hypothetical protein
MQGTDASLMRADQLAPLKQGPPTHESVLPWASRKASDQGGKPQLLTFRHNGRVGVGVMFWVAGFRPGGRPTFVSAKVGKTNDAPPGRIGLIGREGGRGGLTRWARTSPPRTRASDQGDGRQASDQRSNLNRYLVVLAAGLESA